MLFGCVLQFAVLDRSREREHVADVADAGQVHHAALEAEAEARVPRRAVLPQVEIEGVVLRIQSELLHTAEQHVVVVLTLAAADDLADAGN